MMSFITKHNDELSIYCCVSSFCKKTVEILLRDEMMLLLRLMRIFNETCFYLHFDKSLMHAS